MISKKSAIILILVVFLATFGALLWFYFTYNPNQKPSLATLDIPDVYDPFGVNLNTQNLTNTGFDIPVDTEPVDTAPLPINKLRKLASEPTAGFGLLSSTSTGNTRIHYILRANGHIYEIATDLTESRRLSNTTIPKVYESVWLADEQKLILRYLRDDTENIETFSVKINPATSTLNEFEGGIDGNFLPTDIKVLTVNPAKDRIFYLTNNLNGASGFISRPDGLNKRLIFESPLIEWSVNWPKEDTLTFTTKPSANIAGYLYFLNSNTGTFTKILGGINGLTTNTNPKVTAVLYSDNLRRLPRLFTYNLKSEESRLLPWNTLAEKCVWSKQNDTDLYCAVPKDIPLGDYPDIWYQGLVRFADNIWKLNTETGETTLVADLTKEANTDIDVLHLTLDKEENYLFFTNKTDLTLWSLNIN